MDELSRQRYLKAMGITQWQLRSGPEAVEEAPAIEPVPPIEETPALDEPPPYAEAEAPLAQRPPDAPRQDVAGLDWDALRRQVRDCRACELRTGCSQTVFGVGNIQADLLVIGEAPGADEDRQGEPFVGRAGQLLNAMLLAMGFKREAVFIANIVKCRPPRNRDPEPDEVAACESFPKPQVAAIRPEVIVALGRCAAQTLLRDNTSITRMRGNWREYEGIPLMPTFHPAYLLRNLAGKKPVWNDLQQVMGRLGLSVPRRGTR
jgi:DNA polymerase